MNRATSGGHNNSNPQGSPIISGEIGAPLLLEPFLASRTDLLISHSKIRMKRLVAECTALFRDRGSRQNLENVVPEPDRALIQSKSDVATHRDPAQFLSLDQQPALGFEWHKPGGRPALRNQEPDVGEFFSQSPKQHPQAEGEDADMAVAKRLVEFNPRARSCLSNRPADNTALPASHVARFRRHGDFLNGIIADICQSNAHATLIRFGVGGVEEFHPAIVAEVGPPFQ